MKSAILGLWVILSVLLHASPGLTRSIPPSCSHAFSQAMALKRAGNLAASIPYFQKAIRICPNPLFYYNLARTYEGLKKWREAERAYTGAINLDPSNGELRFFRGVVRYHQKQYDSSFCDLQAALSKPLPRKSEHHALYFIGLIHLNQGDLKKAVDSFQEALDVCGNCGNKQGYTFQLRHTLNLLAERNRPNSPPPSTNTPPRPSERPQPSTPPIPRPITPATESAMELKPTPPESDIIQSGKSLFQEIIRPQLAAMLFSAKTHWRLTLSFLLIVVLAGPPLTRYLRRRRSENKELRQMLEPFAEEIKKARTVLGKIQAAESKAKKDAVLRELLTKVRIRSALDEERQSLDEILQAAAMKHSAGTSTQTTADQHRGQNASRPPHRPRSGAEK